MVLTGGVPLSWSESAYGPTAREFIPERWISNTPTAGDNGPSITGNGKAGAGAAGSAGEEPASM